MHGQQTIKQRYHQSSIIYFLCKTGTLTNCLVIYEGAYDLDERATRLRHICDDIGVVKIVEFWEVIPRSMAD
jgi:diphthamide synthase (EF-2-diphthine--ammonia ligase)